LLGDDKSVFPFIDDVTNIAFTLASVGLSHV
jgi:hypothetical protein